jgi:2-polyprenyl-6-hydroxyphenyl methylase/3-demethylubiquinone-9 3-methyltransferase
MPFSFGENWSEYSAFLDEGRVIEAEKSLQQLLQRERLDDLSFLDIGAGSGLFSIAAARLGAKRVVAIDKEDDCLLSARRNIERFLPPPLWNTVEVEHGDILCPQTCRFGKFNIVYAWGSLHHTGAMWRAIENAVTFCSPGSHFVLALYNHTLLSPVWLQIKQFYNRAPVLIQLAMVSTLWTIRGVGRALTGKHPFRAERGMSVWYDAVDWLGGLPYEYSHPDRVIRFMTEHGFQPVYTVRTGRLGCNEFVFLKKELGAAVCVA